MLLSNSEKHNEKLEIEVKEYKSKFEKLLLEIHGIEKKAYENGIIVGKDSNQLTVKIEPIENITNGNYWIFKKKL